MYCPKKETRSLVSLRPVRHEIRYYLVIEATINSYLHRTICVRSPLQVMSTRSSAPRLPRFFSINGKVPFSFETKHRTHSDFIIRKQWWTNWV